MHRGSEVRLHSCADGLGIAEAGAACITLWRAEVTRPRFERQRAALQDVAARNPGQAAFVCVIGAGTPQPAILEAHQMLSSALA